MHNFQILSQNITKLYINTKVHKAVLEILTLKARE